MKELNNLPAPCRIAVVWHEAGMQTRESYHALCRWNDEGPQVTLRRFDSSPADFQQQVVQSVRAWRPHGVLVSMSNWKDLKRLRRALPRVPFVATLVSPADLVDTCVVTDIMELITQARDHFQKCGLTRVALYCSAGKHAVSSRTTAFRAVVPGGSELVFDRGDQPSGRKVVYRWLRELPKPVGVVATESVAACFLLCCCHDLGLRVPQEVQIIGADGPDECLTQEPHLTSIERPSHRIGEVALETLLRYVRHEQPPPRPIIPVLGCTLVVRGSTQLVPVGDSAIPVALQHMQAHASKGITASRVAKLSRVSRATLYKQFEASTGSTPARHLRQLRLQEACRLLRKTDDTLTAIAQVCGFKSLEGFLNFFRRETGQTPTAYRQRMARR